MRVLVTGGGGFIGSHLTEYLLEQGNHVIVVDDFSTGNRRNLERIADHPRLQIHSVDLGDPVVVRKVCEGIDSVYHLAAAVGVALIAKHPMESIHRNIYPTQLLLDELRRLYHAGRCPTLFLASTSEVYGKNPKPVWNESDDLVFGATTKPRWSYGASKAIDEFLCLANVRESNMKIVIGRFFNVVGPRQTGAYGMVLPRFVSAAMEGHPLIVHDDGLQERCFAHVSDVIQGVTRLMNTSAAFGKIFNIGSDQPISILEMARRVISIVNPKSSIQFQSYAEAYDDDFEDIRRRVPDLSRIKNTIGYAPQLDLDAIVRDVWRSMREAKG
ncbi:MAG: NAD-dependent epimerase/dehydratase family protein [Planctomycetota bacterium]